MLTNKDEKINFELLMTPVDALGQDNWVPVVDGAGALVVNLPGAPHAAKQCLGVCLPLFPRVLDTLAERR